MTESTATRAATTCAVLGVMLSLTASGFFAVSAGTAESCRVEVSGESQCRRVQGETLVEQQGGAAVLLLAVPVVLSLAVLLALLWRPGCALAPALVLTFANLIALASIGLLYLPATLLCLTAAVLGRRN